MPTDRLEQVAREIDLDCRYTPQRIVAILRREITRAKAEEANDIYCEYDDASTDGRPAANVSRRLVAHRARDRARRYRQEAESESS